MRSVVRASVFAALVLSGSHAWGQGKSEAERNFELGRQATSLGQYSTACSLFRESYRLERAVGTLINLGDCEEHLGHPSLARDYYEQAFSSLSVTDDRLPLVKDRIAAIEKTAPRLQLRLGDTAPQGTKIKVDGDVIDETKLQAPMLLAPGNH
ncbi:MAG: tetratricopeptide repeat protein, partial [Polyangiaceae bacterium]